MIELRSKGGFEKLTKFLTNAINFSHKVDLSHYGEEGVSALESATPKDSGTTAKSWSYVIERKHGQVSIAFHNSNIQNGCPIAIILQYGHGTNHGGYVSGINYINPALKPVFEDITNRAWKEATS